MQLFQIDPANIQESGITVRGSAHFIERAKDDLRLLLTSPMGQKRLSTLVSRSAAPFDFDADPTTSPTTTNPEAFSENGLRKELGLSPPPY